MSRATIVRAGDPGLQPERTALSWNRTALAISVNAILSIRSGVVDGEAWLVAAGALLLAAAAAAVLVGIRRRHQLRGAEIVVDAPRLTILGVGITASIASITGVASIFLTRAA